MADIVPQHHPVNIEDEMKRSYMDYAMSVIIGRALPDIRDGLKPAHRRVLYGMKTMGLSATRGYRKCAKIVGEVMGNFHPHGDASIYDTLVRLAQDFNMRSPLINGQGNFGSIDGDPPAAPPTLPEKQRKLLELVPGPDFPTGGYIIGRLGIQQAYLTGRGTVIMRAKAEIEESKKGDRSSIVIDAIPYQVNKARLIERIADLVREKTIEGISDIRDESDRQGMRIVIDLKRGEVSDVILNNLYKHTALQSSFGVIMLAIIGGRPKVLSLVELIDNVVEFRREIVRRRTEFELRKAEARRHIREGLKIALDHLDAVITLIRNAANPGEAREGLITQFSLSPIQAQAILDMQLQRLTGLERQKILDELAELLKLIERLLAILSSDRLVMQIVVEELRKVQEKYGNPRRTEILAEEGEFRIEDLIAEEDMAITVSNTGYIKRTAITNYRNQRRGGKGRIGMRTREEDFVSHLFVASTHAYIMIFSDRGRAYWLKVHEIPDVGPGGKGKAIANLVSMAPDERIAALLSVKE